MENYIEIKDLVIDYGESLAVDKVNIKVKKGHLVTLLGPSGCGKSTTLNALAGLITPTSGKIYFNGKDVTRTSPSNRGVGLVFQSYALYPHMSVYDNISFALKSSKEYRNEINEFNQEIEYKILEQKWIALDLEKRLFDDSLNSIKEFKTALKVRDEFIIETENIYKSSIAEAKELIKSEKIKMDGKIKASSDSILTLIEKIEKEIKELNFKASILLKKESSKDKKSLIKSNLEKDIKKLLEDKEKEIKKYDVNVARYKKDFNDNSEKLKKVQKDLIANANKVRNENLNILKNTHNTNVKKLRKEYSISLSLINKKTKAFNKKNNLEANETIEDLKTQKKDFIGEIDRRVKDVAEKVGITKNLNKMVTNLSGGQQQRVAISRTLIKNPDILLLDEPLSNLDAKMRISTREWIRELQQDLGITTIFVTHDQEEAMSISDEIVCMSVGHVQQKSAPMDMYHQPENKFVAGFLGMPMMNFFTKGEMHEKIANKVKIPAKRATFGCRPEHIKLVSDLKSDEKALLKLKVEVSLSEAYGREILVTSHTTDGEIIRFFVDTEELKRGDQIEIALKKSKVYAFENKNDEKVIGRF